MEALLNSRAERRGLPLKAVLLVSLVLLVVLTLLLVSFSVLGLFKGMAERERRARGLALFTSLEHNPEPQPVLEDWIDSELIEGFELWSLRDGSWRKGDHRGSPPHEELDEVFGEVPILRIEHLPDHRAVVVRGRLGDAATALVLVVSVRDLDAEISHFQSLILLYLVLVGLFVVIVGYVLLTRSVVAPIHRLMNATDKVTRGELDTRIAVGGVGEVAELSRRFNVMVKAVGSARDEARQSLAELQRSNRELATSNEELVVAREGLVRSEKLASIGRLSAGVAHEIGNPLSSILASLESLREPDTDEDEARELLDQMREATKRIHIIIRELLDYSRAEKIEVFASTPAVAIQQALRLVEHQPQMRKVKLEVRTDKAARVRLDEGKLVQVLVNLLMNAADAMNGQGQVSVETEVSASGAQVLLRVIDNGPGIPEEHIRTVFEPFFTTKEPGKGTGLGLAITERLLQQMGAQIDVRSAPGRTCFELIFDRVPDDDEE